MNIDKLRFIYHLDDIRDKKNMTVERLCHGICNSRQYRKYLTGVNNISDKRITEFCNVLGISTRDFYYSLSKNDIYQFNSVKTIYNYLTQKNYKKVRKHISEIVDVESFSIQNKKFLDYCSIRMKLEENLIYDIEALDKASAIICYPSCIKNEVFDFVDIIVLLLISQTEIKIKKTDALELLKKILVNNDTIYLSAESRNMIPTIYSTVSILLGRLRRTEESIEVAQVGIEYCNKFYFSKSLTWLYYCLADGYKRMLKPSLAEENAVLCFSNVLASKNANNIRTFYKLLYKDFQKDPFQLIQDYKHVVMG